MVIAEVHIAHPAIPLTPTLQSVPDLTIQREPQPVSDEDTLWLFFSAEGGSMDDLDAALERDPTVTAPLLVAEVDGRRIYRQELTDAAKVVTPALAALGVRILDVRSEDEGWFLRLLLPERDALAAFRAPCEREDIAFRVETLYVNEDAESRGGFGLTDAQREALVIAHERGYFNDPRDVTLQALAAEMGVSSAALGRRIRRAIDALVVATLRSQ